MDLQRKKLNSKHKASTLFFIKKYFLKYGFHLRGRLLVKMQGGKYNDEIKR